jgi:hypothetical protein
MAASESSDDVAAAPASPSVALASLSSLWRFLTASSALLRSLLRRLALTSSSPTAEELEVDDVADEQRPVAAAADGDAGSEDEANEREDSLPLPSTTLLRCVAAGGAEVVGGAERFSRWECD